MVARLHGGRAVTPVAQRRPSPDEVHLWKATLDVSARVAGELAVSLSAAEQDAAARRREATRRARYIAARGWLRLLLSGYLGTDPAGLRLLESAHGKPVLPAAPWLRFNVSHSGSIAVFAVTAGRDVGVDVERIRHDVDVDAVAHRYFSAEQRSELERLSPGARLSTFFAMWTRHEACLKATGVGLSGAHPDDHDSSQWSVQEFEAGPGLAAAVAVEGRDVRIPAEAVDLGLRLRGDLPQR